MARTDPPRGDLAITALYTSGVWWWAELPGAQLLISSEARGVFRATNAALWLASWFQADPRSLRGGLAQRHALIDDLAAGCGAACFVELAAGLSRRGVHFSADPARRYVEVDLPAVIAHKEALLARTPEGRGVLQRPNLRRIAADVASVSLPELIDAPGPDGPLCVIAEGLLMYLDATQQRALWQKIAGWLADHPGSTFLFDLVPEGEQPPPGRLGRWLGWCMRRFTGGRGFVTDARDRHDLQRELLACGFSSVSLCEPPTASAPPDGTRERPPIPMLVFACHGPVSKSR